MLDVTGLKQRNGREASSCLWLSGKDKVPRAGTRSPQAGVHSRWAHKDRMNSCGYMAAPTEYAFGQSPEFNAASLGEASGSLPCRC